VPVFHLALSCCLLGGVLNAASPLTEDIQNELRILEHQLDTTQSGVMRDSERPLERSQVERNLGSSEQRLRSLKTREPDLGGGPVLERQLDRANRPARIGAPQPTPLLGDSRGSSGLR
jgi:hypothetical protein